jgi:phenol hydroxylase P3 protein
VDAREIPSYDGSRPALCSLASRGREGKRSTTTGCPSCARSASPGFFTEANDPTRISLRTCEHEGEHYHFCSDGCRDIFLDEPEKYVQAWLPVHQIYQGNCGGDCSEVPTGIT